MELGREIFRLISLGILSLLLLWVCLVFWLSLRGCKTRQEKIKGVLIALGVLIFFPGWWLGSTAYTDYRERMERKAAKARFDQLCQTAGVSIYKTVPGVDSLFIETPRKSYDAYAGEYDPYGGAMDGDDQDRYIARFLRSFRGKSNLARQLGFASVETVNRYEQHMRGFYSEFPEKIFLGSELKEVDGVRYKYSFDTEELTSGLIIVEPSRGPAPRYAVSYEAIGGMEADHKRGTWGSVLKITDRQTGEVLAQRVGFIYDPCFGKCNDGGGAYRATDYVCPEPHSKKLPDGTGYNTISAQGIAFQVFLREESIK